MDIEMEAECNGETARIWCRRPRWEDVFRSYPRREKNEDDEEDGDKEYKDEDPLKVLDFLFEYRELEVPGLTDACAARLSNALLDAGINIGEYGAETMTRTIIEKGETKILEIGLKKITRGDIPDGIELKLEFPPIYNLKGENAIVRADEMQEKFGGKKGVYIMRPKYEGKKPDGSDGFKASGHCSLWTGEDVIGKNYLENRGGSYAVHFWELK